LVKPVPLEFSHHDFRVFSSEPFDSWALPEAPTLRHDVWRVRYVGHEFSILAEAGKDEAAETLVHILKDPVRRRNLLVLRKPDPADGPLGYFNAYSVFPNGVEQLVGYSKRVPHRFHSSALLPGAGVLRHAIEPAVLAAELNRLHNAGDKKAIEALEKATNPFVENPSKPGVPSVSYRGVRLGHLLFALSEEVAAKAGFRTLYAEAFKSTAGFVARHGWKVLKDKEHSLWCVKHLRPPQGWREKWTAAWNRFWREE